MTEACDTKERENIKSCEFGKKFVNNNIQAQCSEGHEGSLHGSCNESYEKTRSFLCEKCLFAIVSYFFVLLPFVMLMRLPAIAIGGNLTPVSSSQHPEQTRIHPASAINCSPSVNEPTAEMVIGEGVPTEVSSPGQNSRADSHLNHEQAELAKWKSVELFQIIINLLQVTAAAVMINMQWTLTTVSLFKTFGFIDGITSDVTGRFVNFFVPARSSIERFIN